MQSFRSTRDKKQQLLGREAAAPRGKSLLIHMDQSQATPLSEWVCCCWAFYSQQLWSLSAVLSEQSSAPAPGVVPSNTTWAWVFVTRIDWPELGLWSRASLSTTPQPLTPAQSRAELPWLIPMQLSSFPGPLHKVSLTCPKMWIKVESPSFIHQVT